MPLSAAQKQKLRDTYGEEAIVEFSRAHKFLSNFYDETPVVMPDGVSYPTGEHAFRAQKSTDPAERERIASAATPGAAKRLAKLAMKGPHAVRGWYGDQRYRVMRDVIDAKFAAGTPLAARLLATGNKLLVEGNTWGDTEWGVTPDQGGQNRLGSMLMERRSVLAAELDAASKPNAAAAVAPKRQQASPEPPVDLTDDAPEPLRKKPRAAPETVDLTQDEA